MEDPKIIHAARRFQEKHIQENRFQEEREKFRSFFEDFIEGALQLEIYQQILEPRSQEDVSDEEKKSIENELSTKLEKIYSHLMFSVQELLSQQTNLFNKNFEAVLSNLDERMTQDDEVRPYREFTLDLLRYHYNQLPKGEDEIR